MGLQVGGSGGGGAPSGAIAGHMADKSIHGVGELGNALLWNSTFSTTTPVTWYDVPGQDVACNPRGRPSLIICNIPLAYADAAAREVGFRFVDEANAPLDADDPYWSHIAVAADKRGLHMMQRIPARTVAFHVKLQMQSVSTPGVGTIYTGSASGRRKALLEVLEV